MLGFAWLVSFCVLSNGVRWLMLARIITGPEIPYFIFFALSLVCIWHIGRSLAFCIITLWCLSLYTPHSSGGNALAWLPVYVAIAGLLPRGIAWGVMGPLAGGLLLAYLGHVEIAFASALGWTLTLLFDRTVSGYNEYDRARILITRDDGSISATITPMLPLGALYVWNFLLLVVAPFALMQFLEYQGLRLPDNVNLGISIVWIGLLLLWCVTTAQLFYRTSPVRIKKKNGLLYANGTPLSGIVRLFIRNRFRGGTGYSDGTSSQRTIIIAGGSGVEGIGVGAASAVGGVALGAAHGAVDGIKAGGHVLRNFQSVRSWALYGTDTNGRVKLITGGLDEGSANELLAALG